MEEFDFGAAGQSTGTPVTKPTTEMTKIMTTELIKIFELNEYCKFIESDLKKWYQEVEMLTAAKNEGSKIITEYKNKNKINIINSESLLQALNELYKYKIELKSNYIATEKTLNTKKLKYKKIIASYESAWQKALKEYNADPFFVKLTNIQQENALLEEEIQKQEKLKQSTEIELSELKKNLTKKFRENAVEFSKTMIQYKQYVNSAERKKKYKSDNSKGTFQYKLFRKEEQPLTRLDNSDEMNCSSSIDVSVFDDIMIPSENLESQNLEDTPFSDASKEEVEDSEYLNNYPQKMSTKPQREIVDDNESQYFRQKPSECLKLPRDDNPNPVSKENMDKNEENCEEKLKPVKNADGLQQVENEEETSKDVQMECDESISDGSFEKQIGNQRVSADDTQYPKTSSLSSDDLPPAVENFNESTEPQNKLCDQSVKSENEKKEFQSFTGFFMMGNDQDTSKPSIFKLF